MSKPIHLIRGDRTPCGIKVLPAETPPLHLTVLPSRVTCEGCIDRMSDDQPIKGKTIRVTRLDAEGKPTGTPVEVSGTITPDFLTFPETEGWVQDPQFPDTYTMEVSFNSVDPALIALLWGQPLPPKHPRLAFALYCLRRWTIDLVADAGRWLWKKVRRG